MIKALILDIDGVLTDGKVSFDAAGNELKAIDFRDLDAFWEFKRRNILTALVTGEDTPIVEQFKRRFAPEYLFRGCKDKPAAVKKIASAAGIALENICYMGDGKFDLPVMALVGLSACPANAIREVKAAAKLNLQSSGGNGCIKELLDLLIDKAEIK